MKSSCADWLKRFPDLFVDSIGDVERVVEVVTAPEDGVANGAVFLGTPKALKAGLASKASVLVIGPKAKVQVEAVRGDRTVLIAKSVDWAMAKVLNEYFRKTPYRNSTLSGVHSTAVITPGSEIGNGCTIGPHAFIGARVKLGKNVYVGANSVIEDDSRIGDDTVIHPQVFIGSDTQIGQRCEIHPMTVVAKEGFGYGHNEKGQHTRIPHLGRVVLGDDVDIGSGCTIDRATFGESKIDNGTKLDNQIHIGHNSSIGANGLVTAKFVMAGSSKVGANFLTGGVSGVTGHIEVCDNVQLAAYSAIGKTLTKPGQYGGNPLQPLQEFIKTKVAITHLPRMEKQLKRVMKHLGLEDDAPAESGEA